MRGRVELYVVPIVVMVMPLVVKVVRQTITILQMTSPQVRQPREHRHEILQMTSSQERQLKEQSHEVKKEHVIRLPKGEEHLHFEGDVCEDWMETTTSLKHLQHHLKQQQQQTQEDLQAIKLQMERVVTQPNFEEFRLIELQVPPSKFEFAKGFPLEFKLGRKWYKSWDHLQKDLEIL